MEEKASPGSVESSPPTRAGRRGHPCSPMAGRRRGHPRQQARLLLPPPPPEEPSPLEPTNLREVVAVKKTCHTSSSSTSASMAAPDVWADLLDSLLHQIIAIFGSFHDLLAFIATCHSWRSALSSLPPAFRFNFPPLHLQPPDAGDPRHPYRSSSVNHTLPSNFKWKLVDPAKQTASLHRLAPRNLRGRMRYLGCSYGYLIFSNLGQCLLVDAYSGDTMRPPRLKFSGNNHEIYYGILVAPINSPNSQLLLCSRSSMFQWRVGASSWLEHPLNCESLLQIVFFRGEMFAMDILDRLHRIRLAPQPSMQEVAVVWEDDDRIAGIKIKPWLVICDDMLLLVEISLSRNAFFDFTANFKVFRLNFSVEPAEWVKVDNLGNNALFLSFDRRNPTFSCMNPERWGGKSNCIYCASASADSDEAWSVAELGQALPCTTVAVGCSYRPERIPEPSVHSDQLQSLWVLPSLVYGVGH